MARGWERNPPSDDIAEENLGLNSSSTIVNIEYPRRSPRERLIGRQSSFSSIRNLNSAQDGSGGIWMAMWCKRAYCWAWGGSRYSGVACMLISSAAYSLSGLFVKLLAVSGIPSSQTVMCRCAVITVLSGVGLKKMGHSLLGTPKVRRLVFARAICGYVALSTYFYSIQLLPLRDATVLNFTMPVFTAIMAALMLHERWGFPEAGVIENMYGPSLRLTLAVVAGTLFSFLGVLLVSKPEVHFPGGREEGSDSNLYVGVFMALLGASTGALSYIIVRAIGQRGEPPLVCVFAFAALSTPLSALAILFQGYKVPNLLESTGLLMVGLTAYAAQLFLTRGLQLEKAAKATSIQYVKVLCTYLLGVAFLGETPSMLNVLGALLTAAGVLSFLYNTH